MTITKAIILAAGYGTRFLPMTKAMPKEMLPVADKPVIQYVVEDAVAAGIKDIVVVTSSQKRAIEDHFDHSFELEWVLDHGGKQSTLQEVKKIGDLANFIYVRQKGAKGTLPGIVSGYKAIAEGPFLVMWGDDFFVAEPTRCQQLIEAYNKYQAPILCGYETNNPEHTTRYGYAAGTEVEPGVVKVEKIIEKPGPEQAPSTIATVSAFVFTPEFIEYGKKTPPMKNGEYGYTDTIDLMIKDGLPVYAVKIKNGRFFDCGNKLDYMKATIELSLENPEMGAGLRDYLRTLTHEPILSSRQFATSDTEAEVA